MKKGAKKIDIKGNDNKENCNKICGDMTVHRNPLSREHHNPLEEKSGLCAPQKLKKQIFAVAVSRHFV